MASESKIKLFLERVKQFESLDKSGFYHTELGESSLENELKDKFDSMSNMLNIEIYQLMDFPENDLQQIINSLQSIVNYIDKVAKQTKTDFIGNRDNTLLSINSQMDAIMMHKPAFKIAKIDDELLDDLNRKKEQYDEIIAEQLAKAKKISDSAAGVAFQQAQNDFSKGADSNKSKASLWGGIATVFIIAFIVFALYLMGFFQDTSIETQPKEKVSQDTSIETQLKGKVNQDTSIETQLKGKVGIEIFYFTVIRITLFFALGAIISFCLKILRANLHLMERNAHKARLVNNLEPLIESAPENQRELVRSILIQEIASFGKTGLLQKEDDSVLIAKSLMDTVAKAKQGSA